MWGVTDGEIIHTLLYFHRQILPGSDRERYKGEDSDPGRPPG
jgi:hypothetical protein